VALALLVAVAAAVWPGGRAEAQLTLGFEPVASGLHSPDGVTHAGDGSGRLFILEQAGRILIHNGSKVLPSAFLDVSALVSCCGERGLLGLAFHPDYVANGLFYVDYTNTAGEPGLARPPVADVGQNTREEVDFQPAASVGGENYGWRLMEGTACFPSSSSGCNDGTLTLPILEYGHLPDNCSITGGYRYRGGRFPQLFGRYFYGDYCSGRIWNGIQSGQTWSSTQLIDTALRITSFGEDEGGELYVVHHGF